MGLGCIIGQQSCCDPRVSDFEFYAIDCKRFEHFCLHRLHFRKTLVHLGADLGSLDITCDSPRHHVGVGFGVGVNFDDCGMTWRITLG